MLIIVEYNNQDTNRLYAAEAEGIPDKPEKP